jgi:pimeloyl-ACP methyl ester carboxylesterase
MVVRFKLVYVLALAGAVAAVGASGASAAVKFQRIAGYDDPATPDDLDRVGILKVGPKRAPNVLVLNPGTSASAAYFKPLASTIAKAADGWQVWAVERRENQLEDHSLVDRAKAGTATPDQMFDYYLGYITDSSITEHYQPVPDSSVPFARGWGMSVQIEDLRRVVRKAERLGGRVVVGGHSLGGSITTAYATWDFNGRAGAEGLGGLVFIDGSSSTTPLTADEANARLADLNSGSPWLAFGGITAPFAGLFNVVGSTGTHLDPNGVGRLQTWALLPANLKPPVPATNEGAYGYALDTETSPATLAAAQAHLGRLAASGDPRGWDNAGELTPVERYANIFSGTGLRGLDGTAWYHPLRLTIDSGAVGNGIANPAQGVLDVAATHGDDLPDGLRMLAFGAALGGQRVLDSTRALAAASDIPRRRLSLINRATTYAHNDPNSAHPKNAFVAKLLPFLRKVERG